MGSVINYDDHCYNCGKDSLFRDCYYRSGECLEHCTACGYSYSFFFCRDLEKGKRHKCYRIPFSRVYIRICHYPSWDIIQQTRLPAAITQEELDCPRWGEHEERLKILKKFSIPTDDIPQHFVMELVYHLKRKKDVFVRMNFVGNFFEITTDKNPRFIRFYQRKTVEKEQKSYGIMYIVFPGKKKPYARVFSRKPNLEKVMQKWDRIAGEHYNAERSYLLIVEDGKAVYYKGKSHSMPL